MLKCAPTKILKLGHAAGKIILLRRSSDACLGPTPAIRSSYQGGYYNNKNDQNIRHAGGLGNVLIQGSDWIGLELARPGHAVLDVRQPRHAVALETAVQGRTGQVRYRGLKGVEAIVEWQERVLTERDIPRPRTKALSTARPSVRSSDQRRSRSFSTWRRSWD